MLTPIMTASHGVRGGTADKVGQQNRGGIASKIAAAHLKIVRQTQHHRGACRGMGLAPVSSVKQIVARRGRPACRLSLYDGTRLRSSALVTRLRPRSVPAGHD